MFSELTEELLDLTVVDKGYGNALFAHVLTGGGACSACCTTCCVCVNC